VDTVGNNECYDFVKPIIYNQSLLSDIRKFYFIMQRYTPDIVIIRGFSLKYFLYSMIARKHTNRIILYTQDPFYVDNKNVAVFRTKKIIRNLISKVRITPVLGESNEQNTSLPHEYYVPFHVEENQSVQNREYFRNNAINIFCIGKLFLPRKNHFLLLRAINYLKYDYNIRLTIFGSLNKSDDKYFNKIREFIGEHELNDIVSIRFNVPYYECRKEYLNQDLYILPSSDEPAAISPLEAMSAGLPVVCSDSSGTRCYIEEGVNGFIFKSDDLDDLIDKIQLIISDRHYLRRMGEESRIRVRRKYSSQFYERRILEVIDKEFNG
jgi:glycosyltransferase involved in cell wall biosynthesis